MVQVSLRTHRGKALRVHASALLAGILTVGALAACSSSGGSGTTGGTSTAPTGGSNSSTSGPSTSTSSQSAASGSPISIGLINQENSAAGSFPEARQAAQAAGDLINNQLGGVNGHPIKFDTCISDGTPVKSAQCGRQLVADKVAASVIGLDIGSDSSVQVLQGAKIPVVPSNPVTASELTSPDAFSVGSGTAGFFPTEVQYAVKTLKIKSAAVIYVANAAGEGAAKAYVQGPLNSMGVSNVKMLAAAADAADFTSSLQQVGNAAAVFVLMPGQSIGRIMAAKASLGISSSVPYFYPVQAWDPSVTGAGGAGADNAYAVTSFDLDTSGTAQAKQFASALKQYAPGTTLSGLAVEAFATVMDLYTVLKTITGTPTAAKITAAYKKTKNTAGFMSHSFTCDGKQFPNLVSVCNGFNRIIQFKNGAWTTVTSYADAAQILGG